MNNIIKVVPLVVATAFFLAACAGTAPLIDNKGVDPAQLALDEKECKAYAAQVAGPGTGAAAGAVGGAVLGYVLGKAARLNDPSALARTGAVAGGVGGAARGYETERQVVARCMQGRGYRVLH